MWSEIISRSKPRPSTVWAQRRNRPGVVPGPKFGTFTPNCTGQGYPATTRKERMPAWMWPLRQRVQRQVMVTRVPGTGPRAGDGPACRGRARVPGTGPRGRRMCWSLLESVGRPARPPIGPAWEQVQLGSRGADSAELAAELGTAVPWADLDAVAAMSDVG